MPYQDVYNANDNEHTNTEGRNFQKVHEKHLRKKSAREKESAFEKENVATRF